MVFGLHFHGEPKVAKCVQCQDALCLVSLVDGKRDLVSVTDPHEKDKFHILKGYVCMNEKCAQYKHIIFHFGEKV